MALESNLSYQITKNMIFETKSYLILCTTNIFLRNMAHLQTKIVKYTYHTLAHLVIFITYIVVYLPACLKSQKTNSFPVLKIICLANDILWHFREREREGNQRLIFYVVSVGLHFQMHENVLHWKLHMTGWQLFDISNMRSKFLG